MMDSFQHGFVVSSRESQRTAPIDKWFVGSSSKSTSGRAKMAAARHVRTCFSCVLGRTYGWQDQELHANYASTTISPCHTPRNLTSRSSIYATCQPPLSAFISRFIRSSLKPRFRSKSPARFSALSASIAWGTNTVDHSGKRGSAE